MERPMMRPVMDPTFMKDLVETKRNRPPLLQWIARAVRWFWRGLFSNPLAIHAPGEAEKQPGRNPWKVLLRVAICWSIALPILVGLMATLAVFLGTHPAAASITSDPNSQGVYFETVNFVSDDGTLLTGWLIPAIDAHRVVEEKDRTLRLRRPAMVLAHDYGQSMQEMLPLVQPLHDEGVVVLVIGLRGSGTSGATAQTFGIHEAKDITAAVGFLRRTASVDASRVGVAGIGSGANAALIASASDATLSAIVLANPVKHSDEVISKTLTPHNAYLAWMQPLCRRVFEMTYGVEARDIDFDRYASVVKTRPMLVLDSGEPFILSEASTIKQVKAFCRRRLHTQDAPMLSSGR
jgi:hypothetical protein